MKSQAFAAAVLLALPLIATDDAAAQRTRMRFAEMDRNGDGRISRQEWRGSERSFIVHDWNNDGVLAGDEVRPGGRRAARQEEDFPEGRLEMRDWTARNFTNLDHNRDGRIARNEWHYDMEAFRRADRNRDNVLTRSEFLGEGGFDDDRDDRFVDLDLNGNGRVERSEWHGSREGFEWLDRNRDNTLTYDEVAAEDDEASRDTFASIDIDRSGVIERDEWHWSRGSFDRRDANRDGRLSRTELGMAEPTTAVGTTGRTIVVDSRVRWTDTGIDVRAGDMMTLNVQGNIRMSNDSNDVADPWGARSGRKAQNSPVNTMPAGGLIAMVSGSTPVFVGNRTDTAIRVPATGRLYLGVNDDHLADNAGEFRVSITIQR